MKVDKKILVTGGAGFIGSHILDRLVREDYEVVCVDNLSGLHITNKIYVPKGVRFIHGDISNYGFIEKVIIDHHIDAIFHVAANANVPYSDDFPMVDFQSNALGTFNLLNLAIKQKVKKFVFSSTAAVYGEPQYTPIDESHPLCPISNYGVTKLYGEKLGMAYHKTYDLDFSALRVFNTYGPRQPRYVLYDLIKKLSTNKNNLDVLGDGTQIRDYSYVENTVDAFMMVFESPKSRGEVYNIAGGQPISIKDLVSKISNLLEVSPQVFYTGMSWKGDIINLTSDISKIETELGYKAVKSFDQGLRDTITWFKAHDFKDTF